jgi:hypothetical protein
MREDYHTATCEKCNLPLVELDAYGERLQGCVGCNDWQSLGSGEWRRLSDEDIVALRGMVSRWTRAAEHLEQS